MSKYTSISLLLHEIAGRNLCIQMEGMQALLIEMKLIFQIMLLNAMRFGQVVNEGKCHLIDKNSQLKKAMNFDASSYLTLYIWSRYEMR